MPEFLDFLKHKYAYVAIGEFKPGCFSEAQKLYEKAVSTYSTGFQGAFLLQKPGPDDGLGVVIWDIIVDMVGIRSEAQELLLKSMAPLFAKPPVTDFYEVCSEIEGSPI